MHIKKVGTNTCSNYFGRQLPLCFGLRFCISRVGLTIVIGFLASVVNAADLELELSQDLDSVSNPATIAQLNQQYRWQSQDQIRGLLGEPRTVRAPVGTHATYTLWEYDRLVIAFANERVIHVFAKDVLHTEVAPEPE